MKGPGRWIRIGSRILALAPAFLLGLPAQWVALRLNSPLSRTLPVIFHRYLLLVLGVRLRVSGTPSRERPLLITANHLSWLDIVVISSLMPVSFIAKSEVARWPFFGTLARLQRSIFVERERRGKTVEKTREIAARMQRGDTMVLFAEGTTSDGARILPFRSALIGSAQAAVAGKEAAYIQPLNIAYPALAGLPIGRANLPLIAWYGDMDLLPHLADFLCLGDVTAQVSFGAPRRVAPESDRKALTRSLENEVRALHIAAMSPGPRAILADRAAA